MQKATRGEARVISDFFLILETILIYSWNMHRPMPIGHHLFYLLFVLILILCSSNMRRIEHSLPDKIDH